MSGEKSLMSGVVGIVSGQERINSHFFYCLSLHSHLVCGSQLSGPFNSPLLSGGRYQGQITHALKSGQNN